jgi:drug/metabolite transporter (DMT)-like permease
MCLSGWVLVIVRMWRPEQITIRLAWALGIAICLVSLLWAIESSLEPIHWQRDGSGSVLTGCLASILASWCWIRKSKGNAAESV